MSVTKKSASRDLLPSILALILMLAPLAMASAQSGDEPSATPDVDGTASSQDASEKAHHPGKGCCGRCNHASSSGDRKGMGHCCRGAHKSAKGTGHQGPGRVEMQNAHFLVINHDRLERRVEEIPNGVQTVTTTTDPELLEPLRQHVHEMSALLEDGGHVRKWDPLFAEIFEHRDAIQIEIEEIDDGVRVTETSEDEEVVELIRAHADKIDQFLARGQEACREETPLPSDYAGK